MKYFPLSTGSFQHQFGVRALQPGESWLETTEHYADEIALRRESLTKEPDDYFQTLPDSLAAQRDAASLLIQASEILSATANLRTGEPLGLANSNAPLRCVSRHLQEDLAIMRNDPAGGFPLIAGSVCFPSGWCIGDKLGRGMAEIHAPVPRFAELLAEGTRQLMIRLKPGRPVWRLNWGIRPSGQLDQSPRHQSWLAKQAALVTVENALERCYFRVERQTLVKLPSCGDILFTIHTHQQKLGKLSRHQQLCLLGVLRSCPAETLAYKGILPMGAAIEKALEFSSPHHPPLR